MGRKKTKWIIYTVLVGLIPILSRLFIWLVTKTGPLQPFTASDFVAFGLILHISNINEIEHATDIEKSWKTIQNGISIIFITFYSVLFSLALIGEQSDIIEVCTLTLCAFSLSLVSFLISYSVHDRMSKLPSEQESV